MSDSLSGTFRNIADYSGHGQDHCELVGASVDPPSSALDSDYKSCSGTGYYRKFRGQQFTYAAIGDVNGARWYGRWYECGIALNLDVDECTNGTANCSAHATCNNTPGGFNCTCDAGYSGDGVSCAVCTDPLGMESGAIPDDSITASSTYGFNREPYRGRLNGVAGVGAWAVLTNTIGEWLQVDLGEMETVTGTIIQGRYGVLHNVDQWVTSYKLQYSVDGLSWITYASSDGSEEVFPGNTDRNTPVTNLLDSPTDARYVRFLPQSWHGWMSMRVEVLGCSGIWLRRDSSWVVDSTGTPFVDNGVTYDAAKALDGNTSTYWNVIDTGQNHSNWYIVMDIAAPQNLTRIAVNSYGDTTHDIAAFTLQKSQVGSPYSWEDVVSVDNVQGGTDQRQEFGGFQGTARYWRFVVTRTHEGWQPYLTELNLYSTSPVNSLTLRTSNTSVYDASEDSLTVEIFSDLCDDVCTNTTVSGLTDVGKGYRLSTDPSEGSPQVVVDVDGKVCPELPLLNNGNRTEGHLYGNTVTFSCNEGYELIGSENRTCQADQTWSGVQPNCNKRLVLVTQCDDCPTASTTYLWTLVGGKHIDWDVDTTTGNTSQNLVVRSNIFEAGESYTFRVDVTSDVVPGGTGFSEYSFRVNKPPTVGSCAVSPSSGDSTITQFDISCEGARDDDLPLVYSLYFNNDGSDTLLHTGTTERFPPQLLPAGQEHRDFNITLEVRVSDALRATSVIRNIKVQVRPPSVEDTAVALDSLNDTLENLLHKGDNHGLLQLTNSLSSVLNAANASSYSNDSLSKARDGLINSLTRIPVQSLDNVDQVAGALGLATALEEQVTPQSQESAAQTVLQMSNFLETPEKEDVACVNLLQASTASATKSKELPSSETRDRRLDKNKIATQTTFVAIGKLNAAVLDQKVPGESPTTFSVGEFNLAVEKQRCDSTNGQPHVFRANNHLGSSTFFVVPSLSGLLGDSCETEGDVGIENFKTPRNPYAFANTSDDVKSEVGGLQFLRNGRPLEIRDLTDPVEVFTRRLSESSQNGRTMTELGTTAPSGSGNISTHQFNMTEGRSLYLTVTPHLANVSVRLYLKRGDEPSRIDEFDRNTTLPLPDDADLFTLSLGPTETMTADRWTWFIPGSDVDPKDPVEHMHYLGVEHVPQTEQGDVSPSVSPEYQGKNFTLNYTLQIFSTQCLYFNEESEDFESDGCQPGPLSSAALSHCRCDHLTAFGSGFTFFIAPNKLNILETLRKLNPAENPVVIIAVSVLFGIYILVVIWARRKDRQDSKKIGATILRGDQGRFHDHFYQITVLTGSRSESSTSARVFLTLMGEGGTSGPHELEDRDRTILKEGGVDTFILPTSRHLGSLYAVHVWHDNTGPCPSWFLDKIILQDLSDGKKYSFLCQRWLAVEEGDGRVDCLLSSATDEQLSTLRLVFGSQTSKAFNDGHLWASVLGRPAYSPFTRVQRVSCCLSLLLCTMVTNIAFFGIEKDFGPPPTIDILGFKVQIPISWAQRRAKCLAPAERTALSRWTYRTLPQNVSHSPAGRTALSRRTYRTLPLDVPHSPAERIALSRRTSRTLPREVPHSVLHSPAERPSKIDAYFVACAFMIAVQSCLIIFPINLAIVEIFRHVSSPPERKDKNQRGSSASSITSDSDVVSLEEIELKKIDKAWDFYRQPYSDSKMTEDKKKGCILPWWCVFIAWFLVFASCVVSAFFTILYGQAYGREKAEEWLFVFFTSFFADLFVLQPVKVVLLAVGLTLVLRKPHDDAENQTPTLDYEEVCAYLSTIKATPVKECREEPPDSTKLAEMRVRRFVEISMKKAMYEFAFYFLFVLVLVVIANGPRDTGMFHMTQHLRKTVDDGGDHSFTKASTVDDAESFWNFVRYTLSPALYGNRWYNDDNREPDGFMADKTSYVVGPVRIRQLRVAEDPSCKRAWQVQHIFKDCTNAYSQLSHDSNSYGMDVPVVGTHATYWDGGYFVTVTNTTPAADLATVAQLEPSGWIDRYTRAVFVEMTVYNPHANLFSVVSLLTEFTAMGKAYPRVDITTVRLYRFQTPWAWVVVGFQGVFIIFTLYFVFRELDLILKLRSLYLKTFWGCVELGLALLSLAEVGVMLYTLYIVLDFQSKPGTNKEPAERPFEKYRRAAYWDQINTYVLGCLVCVGTLKLLHLLRFNKHVVLGADIMKKAAGALSGFFLIFTIVFVAFATFAFLVFCPTEEGFSPFVATVESMFTILLGKFYELSDAKTVMGPLFTFTFITFFQWVILTMVVAILDGAIHEVAEQNSQQKPETEQVADLMLERLQSWVGGLLQRAGNGRSSSASQEDYNPTEEELTDFLTNADFVRLQGRQESSSTTIEFCIEN
ncbi:hypothetical protein Bbelb_116690 [Branchiostoma belcheri]|nr:hypothetical protein Bbelb_116690 [Branchiostoma belcheri]